MSWIRSQNSRRALASTPAVGSSRSNSIGWGRARAGGGEPRLPAARELSRKLLATIGEPHAVHDADDRFTPVRHVVHACDEVEIFKNRQVLVEAELLRHVASLAADQRGFTDNVMSEASPAPAIGDEKPAQHSDSSGLAAAVGAKKTADLAPAHLQSEPVDDFAGAKTLPQVADVDGEVRHGGPPFAIGRTATGWPGLSTGACCKGGRASTL